MVTIATVGYGDYYPVTIEGRFVAVGLMIAGVALIGVVTASFAAWFISRVAHGEAEEQAAEQAATRRDMDVMVAQLDNLTREVRALRESVARDR